MTTVGDSIKAAIDANWNVGTGGTEPPLYNSEDVQMWPSEDDWVMILGWTFREAEKQRNDAYQKVTQYIDMRVHSKNDANGEERLDELVTEIKRVINATNVTGYHKVKVIDQNRRASDKRQNRYIADLTVELKILSTSSTATPGSTTTSELEVDELTVNTWIKGSPTAKLSSLNVGCDAIGREAEIVDDILVRTSAAAGGDALLIHADTDGATLWAHTNYDPAAPTVGWAKVMTLKNDQSAEFHGTLTTATPAQIDDLMSFGSANAAWVNCPLEGWQPTAAATMSNIGELENVDATDFFATYAVPLPPLKAGLKLYVSGTRISLSDADEGDYITNTYTEAYTTTGKVNLDTDPDDKNTVALHPDTFTAVDCSSYYAIKVRLQCVATNAADLNIQYVLVQCYYAA